MPRPATALFTWATAALAELNTPSASRKSLGFESGQPLPAGQLNYLIKYLLEWGVYLGNALTTYDDLADADADLADGDVCVVYEDDSATVPGETAQSNVAGFDCADVVCTGTTYCTINVTGNTILVTSDRVLGGSTPSCTPTNAGTLVRLATDGVRVFAAYGNYVEAFLLSTQASVWVYNHGATVNDICCYNGMVFLVGAVGTGTKEARGLSATAGTATWSYRHNGTLNACAAGNGRVVIGGTASGFASGANIRYLEYATGNDLANEGGTAADTTGRAWDIVLPGSPPEVRTMCTDGQSLYIVYANADLYVLSMADGTVVHSDTTTFAATLRRCAVDQEYLFIARDGGTDGWVYCLDKRTFARVWDAHFATLETSSVDTDGMSVLVGFTSVGGGESANRVLVRGNKPQLYRKGGSGNIANPKALVWVR